MGHHIVAVFVHVPNHFGQGGRVLAPKRHQSFGHRAELEFPADLSSQVPPQTCQGPHAVLLGPRWRHGPHLLPTGLGISTAHSNLHGLRKICHQHGPVVCAGPWRQWHGQWVAQAPKRWLHPHVGHWQNRIGCEGQEQGVEIHQHRIRPHVVRLEGLPIKGAWVFGRRIKERLVNHPVALNALHAHGFERLEHLGGRFQIEFGVARAAHIHTPLQHPALDGSRHIHRGLPNKSGSQQVQCRLRGDEFDQGRWASLLLRMKVHGLQSRLHIAQHHTQALSWQVQCLHQAKNRGGQLAVVLSAKQRWTPSGRCVGCLAGRDWCG